MPENDSARARMHAQIQALMTTALHPNTPPEEAMASREGALYLAACYSVEEALAEAGGAPGEKPEVEDFVIDDEAGALPGAGMPALARLFIQIARSLHCVAFDWGNPSGGITVCGRRSDLATVRLLWGSLRLQAIAAAVNTPVPPGRSERHFRAGVMEGFADEVAEQLWRPEDDGGPGVAAALRSRESEARDFWREYINRHLRELVRIGHAEAFRRPDGVVAYRLTAARLKALADGES